MAYTGKRFRRHRIHSSGRLHPLITVGICLGIAVIAALITGNLLHLWLDDEALEKLTSGTKEPISSSEAPERTVAEIRAYPFTLGASLSSLVTDGGLPPSALSVSLNTPDGAMLYTSEVSRYLGFAESGQTSLTEGMTELYTAVPYLCGVFYPQAFQQEQSNLFYAETAKEAALLHEIANAGVSELLLVGLPLDAEHLSQTIAYLTQIREALGEIPLGVAVPLSAMETAQSWELLPYLQKAVSYLALDLQSADESESETVMLSANYYLVGYKMRLLLASDQTAYISIAEATVSDFQILTAPPRSDSDEPQE